MLRTRVDLWSLLSRTSPQAYRVWERTVTAFESRWVAYPLLVLLQLKCLWRLWVYRDVPVGDTTSYFVHAWSWFTGGGVNIAWSPLYTAFYGSFLFLNSDPVWATYAHRVVIVVLAAVMVLAVLRYVLPPSIAWVCAAWWTVLPMVFNTLYEVHLFAVIPVLGVWLLLLSARGPWRRAAALGLLAATAILVRNELSVAVGVLGLALAWYEWRRGEEGNRPGRVVLAYVTALVLAAGLVVMAYRASEVQYPLLRDFMKAKHTVNMAQVYAYGHQQRHPEWTHSPWLECYPLMEQTFGDRLPTLRQMIAANPRAVWEHFAWNFSLTPNGIQLLMFSCASGLVSPDYDSSALPRMNSPLATKLTVLVLTIWAVGLFALRRGRREIWRDWLSARALGWVGMFAVATVVPLVIATQRPRPSYLFAFLVLLIAMTGMFFHAATYGWRIGQRLRYVMPILMVAVILLAPRQFTRANAVKPHVADDVRRLLPYRAELMQNRTRMVLTRSSAGTYLCPIAIYRHPKDQLNIPLSAKSPCPRSYEFADFLGVVKPGESFGQLLDRYKITHVYLEEWSLNMLAGRVYGEASEFISGTPTGWELVTSSDTHGERWRFFRRKR